MLRTLRQEPVERPPVWMMRQAGRYLPSYMRLREKYDFFTRVQTPALACEITLQPIDQLDADAAILFSDILVIPQAMGMQVLMEEGKGPVLPKTIRSAQDINALTTEGAEDNLCYVYDALQLTKSALNDRVPLIGFAGGPWTILCYMVEGKSSKTWEKAKQFAFTQPQLAQQLLQKITDLSIAYLKRQVKAGADILQVFDSWAGTLGPDEFNQFAKPYLLQIADALQKEAPLILFPKGSWYALEELSRSTASAVGIDWCISPQKAREWTGGRVTLQGNFDPARLLAPVADIKKGVKEMINAFGKQKYIANLGHGISPQVPVDHARAFVDAVKESTAW